MPTTAASPPIVPATTSDPRRWWVLAAVTAAQLMIGLDLTIMNVALPSAQRSLDLSDPGRQWVITIFALGYGGLLLLGGRLSDLMGRRYSLMIGLTGFAVASVLGGAASGPAMLLTSRGLQGAFGALLTPSILAALAAAFPLPAERGKAFGIYATAIGSSSGLGVVLGGVLTSYLNWRWCMFVNVPIAVAAAAGVLYSVRPTPRTSGIRVDITGALLATTGLMALVFGFARAESDGWGGTLTVGALVAGVLALAAFALVQSRVAGPLLPPRVVLDRRRGGSYLAVLSLAVGMFAALFFLTFYLQDVLGYSPIRAGLAFLPVTAGLMVGHPNRQSAADARTGAGAAVPRAARHRSRPRAARFRAGRRRLLAARVPRAAARGSGNGLGTGLRQQHRDVRCRSRHRRWPAPWS